MYARGYRGWPVAKAFRMASPAVMRRHDFPAGPMGPKVDAAWRFAEATGERATIGALKNPPAILKGRAGTTVTRETSAIEWAAP